MTIELYADGEATGRTLVLSEANGWKGAFADLDERSGGSTIDYSVRESDVAGYSCAIAGDMQAGFTVTNTHVPDEPKKPPKPETPKASGMPKTGDDSPVGFLLALAAVSASAIAAYAGLRTGGSRRGALPPR